MDYVIAGLLVLLIVAGGVTLLMRRARRHGRHGQRAASDPEYGGGLPGGEAAVLAPDPKSPLGDTSEHAGQQQDGETVSDQDAERSGGSGRAVGGGYAGTADVGAESERRRARDDSPHVAPPVDGGEGEGRRRV